MTRRSTLRAAPAVGSCRVVSVKNAVALARDLVGVLMVDDHLDVVERRVQAHPGEHVNSG